MTFDELWRLNLTRGQPLDCSTKKQETVEMHGTSGQSSSELILTAEDYEFLTQVGIKP